MSYLDPGTWRAFTKEEMLSYLDRMKRKPRQRKKPRKGALVLQQTVSPFDAYTYLHARFGPPNGMQTFLAKNDSDNLFHWDYNLRAGKKELIFIGATEEVHVWFDADMSDADWSAHDSNSIHALTKKIESANQNGFRVFLVVDQANVPAETHKIGWPGAFRDCQATRMQKSVGIARVRQWSKLASTPVADMRTTAVLPPLHCKSEGGLRQGGQG